MIIVRFFMDSGTITGFEVKGHSGSASKGNDIVCAAVSSAAYMTANTMTEVLGLNPDIRVKDGYMKLTVNDSESAKAQELLSGFALHMRNLSGEYPLFIKIIYGGKRNAQN